MLDGVKECFREYFLDETRITKQAFLVLFLVYLAASNTYYFSNPFLSSLIGVNESQVGLMTFFIDFSMASSMILGVFLLKKARATTVIFSWALASASTTLILMVVQGFYARLLLVSIQNISLGLCVLSFNIIFCSKTVIEERGRVGAAITALSLFLGSALSLSLIERRSPFIIYLFFSACALIAYRLNPREEEKKAPRNEILNAGSGSKNFLVYYLPWLLFSLNSNAFPAVTQTHLIQFFPQFLNVVNMMKFFGAVFGSLIGGYLSDKIGRKPVLLIGLTLLGAVFTLAGLTVNPMMLVIVFVLTGFCWGSFLVIYHMILWGEFDQKRVVTYYSIGLSTFHFSRAIGFLALPYMSDVSISTSTLISALTIFISIIPLISAKETLPTPFRAKIADSNYINHVKNELKKIIGKEKGV